MGREQKRKEAKRKGNNVKETTENINSGVEKLTAIKITIVVISLLAIIYLILAIFVTKELDLKTDKEETTENSEDENSTSVSNKILGSAIFKQSEESYYVLLYNFEDEDDTEVANALANNLTDKKTYKVDINSGMNKNYVSEVSNPNATSLEDLKVSQITLLQIDADKITNFVEGKTNIEEYIK